MRMRVLIIDDFFIGGGAESVARMTKDLLSERGYDCKFFFGSERVSKPKSVASYLYSVHHRKRLSNELSSFIPDVIHIHNYYHVLSVSIFHAIRKFKRDHKVKVLYTAHDFHLISPSSNLLYFKNGPAALDLKSLLTSQWFKTIDSRGIAYSLLKKIQWVFERKLFKPEDLFDGVICPSRFLESLFRANGKIRKMFVIRNPLDVDPDSILNLKVSYGSKREKDIRFVFFGRLSEEKGLKVFLNYLKNFNREAFVDLFGEGSVKEELELFAKDNGMCNVRFHGFIDFKELETRLCEYDVAVLPSVGYENAPLVVPESAANGLVVFGSDLGGVKEMCELSNIPHFLYKPTDSTSFCVAYTALISFFSASSVNEIPLYVFSKDNYVATLIDLYNTSLAE